MSKLQELIQELCPDGVEYRPLKDVAKLKRGTSLTKKLAILGEIPVISGGKEPAFYCNKHNNTGETITVAGSGAGAGFLQYWDKPIFVCDAFSVKRMENLTDTKYLYYVLQNQQEEIFATKKGGGVPHVHISDIDTFNIPLPPLPVQREIVRILDNFTKLTAGLTAKLTVEHTARKKQYEYYRDNLLTLHDEVEWLPLSNIFDVRNGYTPSKKEPEFWNNGNIPWFRLEDIRTNGHILNDALQHITEKGVKKSGLFPKNSIMISTTATLGEHALITTKYLSNQQLTNISIKEKFKERVIPKFVFYYCFILDKQCFEIANYSGGIPIVDQKKFKDLSFPIPSLSEQKRIVSILDRFDTLCNDLTSGLPAEIAARQRQYEYYRDRLLTFKQLSH